MTTKTQLGKTYTVWDNNSAKFPREVQDHLGIRPGDQFRFMNVDGRVEIEKV